MGEATGMPHTQRSDRPSRTQAANNIIHEGSVSLNLAESGASATNQSVHYRPSAPPIEDKNDLPPSYETLYPDRCAK